MGLMDRISTLLKADAHGVVDTVEDRSLLLRQHVREAELELHRKRARVEALNGEGKQLGEERGRLEATLARLEEDIALALKGDKEALARFAIKKQIPLKRRLEHVSDRIERCSVELAGLETALGEHESEFESLRARVKVHLSQAEARERGELIVPPYDAVVADEEIELELLRRTSAAKRGRS